MNTMSLISIRISDKDKLVVITRLFILCHSFVWNENFVSYFVYVRISITSLQWMVHEFLHFEDYGNKAVGKG